MASGTASGQARPGRGLSLDQAVAPEQALPLALESSGAPGVDLEQEKERDLLTHLASPGLSTDRKDATAFKGTPAHEPALPRLSARVTSPPHLPELPRWAQDAPALDFGRGPPGVMQGS